MFEDRTCGRLSHKEKVVARKARYGERELAEAMALIASAKTVRELRLGQAILIPALTGASIDDTARLLGIGRNLVCVLRRQFRQSGAATVLERERRGGRRRQLMSLNEERSFIATWIGDAPQALNVSELHAAYEAQVGKKVPRSTIYRLLSRQGLRSNGGSHAVPVDGMYAATAEATGLTE
jgi:transposase